LQKAAATSSLTISTSDKYPIMADVKNKTVAIYIDQSAAINAFDSLQKKADGFSKKIEQCREKQRELLKVINDTSSSAAAIKKAEKEFNSLEKTINASNQSLLKTKDAQKLVQDQMDLGLRPSISQTETLVRRLRNELKHLSEDAPGYAKKFEAYQKAVLELDRLESKFKKVKDAQKNWMEEVKVIAAGVIVGGAVQAVGEGVSAYLSGIVDGNAKLSDELSDIEKATDQSAASVENLNRQIGKIDTRTKNSDLREIAVGLGQLGEQANKANVEAIDKIVVALGDEYGGGAKQITTDLSVLRNNLQDIKTGDYAEDILRIGNALNVAGAEGLATAPVVTDIANRIAGTAQQFKLTAGQILGVAATFQELGIETERGSTAIQAIFKKMGAEPEKFARVAGLSIKEFKELVNTDMLGAFQAVAAGAKKAGADNVTFSKILKELDADGAGAGEVLSKLGSNSDLLSKKVVSMTTALGNGNSILEEFKKKNTNLAAEVAKLSKDFNSLTTSKTLTDFFTAGVSGARHFIAAIKAVPGFIEENKTAVYFLVAGIALLNASYIKAAVLIARDTAMKVWNATVTKTIAAVTNIVAASELAYYEIKALLTRQITLATAAQRLWSTALLLGAGPLGVVITLLGAAVVAISLMSDKTKALTAAQKLNLEVQKKVSESTAEEVSNLELLTKVASDSSVSLKNREKALAEIIKIAPEYLKGLTLENIATAEGKKLLDDYVASLKEKAAIEAKSSLLADKLKEREDLFLKLRSAGLKMNDEEIEKAINNPNSLFKKGGDVYYKFIDALRTAGLNLQDDGKILIDNLQQIKSLQDDITNAAKKDITKVVKTTTTTTETNVPNPFGDDKTKEQQAAEAKAKKEADVRNKLLEQLKDFQFELSQIGKTADQSEIDRITKKYNELTVLAAKYGDDEIKLYTDKLSKSERLAIEFLQREEQRKIKLAADAGTRAGQEQEYKDLIQGAVELGEKEKDIQLKLYADKKINKRQLEDEIRRIDLDTLDFQIAIAESYIGRNKDAYNNYVEFRRKKNKQVLTDEVKDREFSEAQNRKDELAKAQLGVLKTTPGTEGRLQAQKVLLQVEQKQALQATDLTENEIARIKEEYRQKEAQLIIDFYAAQVQQILGTISQGLDIISQFDNARANREKAALDRELKQNETRKAGIRRLAETRVISENEATRRIRQIELQEEKKKEELEKKQQARAKRIAIAQAIINGAMAITSTLAATPGPTDILSLGAFRAIQIGLAIATTAAQISTITSTKYGKGGKLTGPSHDQGGMPVINPVTGQKEAEVEGGEYIISKHTVANNKEIADALLYSSMNLGGARIRRFWEARPYRTIDYPRVASSMQKVKFADGGVFGGRSSTMAPAAPATDPVVLEAIRNSAAVNLAVMETMNNLNGTLKKGIKSSISRKVIQDDEDLDRRIKADSEFK
jgi:TP901 family phage tail tape measure protein